MATVTKEDEAMALGLVSALIKLDDFTECVNAAKDVLALRAASERERFAEEAAKWCDQKRSKCIAALCGSTPLPKESAIAVNQEKIVFGVVADYLRRLTLGKGE